VDPLVNCRNARSDGWGGCCCSGMRGCLVVFILRASMDIQVRFSGHSVDVFLKRVNASLRALQ